MVSGELNMDLHTYIWIRYYQTFSEIYSARSFYDIDAQINLLPVFGASICLCEYLTFIYE